MTGGAEDVEGAGVIRILIADDHPVVRDGLRWLLANQPDMVVVGEATDGVEAENKARQLRPDVIILDLMMPRADGTAALVRIRKEQPEARILVLTSFFEVDRLSQAARLGALGCLLKDSSPRELLEGVRSVARGERYMSPSIAGRIMRELGSGHDQTPEDDTLSDREQEVLELLARGLSNQEMAEELVISERTVRGHVSSILSKLRLSSRTQAALYAIKRRSVQPDQESPRR